MLWRKSLWETRWTYSTLMGMTLLFAVSELPLGKHYDHMWSLWFKSSLLVMWPVYAVIMGATVGAASCPWMPGAQGAAGLFTFSLPVSRRRVLFTHAALVVVEMSLVALAPSLIFPIAARLISGDVSFCRVVVHALLLSVGGMVFISLTFLLMAVFDTQWKVMSVGLAIVFGLFFTRHSFEEFHWWNIYHLMSGETYFRYGQIPWLGLLASLGASALMMSAAARIYERRDL